jgi:hypothetical protein
MKSIMIPGGLLLLLTIACNNADQQANEKKSDNDMDAARNFLEAALHGNYKEASAYMLQDSTNMGYLDATERNYKSISPEEKRNLKEASLRFYDPLLQNDSTTIIVFANSYKNDKDTLKVVKKSGQWLVDLKYLFEHDNDTMINTRPGLPDTIHK